MISVEWVGSLVPVGKGRVVYNWEARPGDLVANAMWPKSSFGVIVAVRAIPGAMQTQACVYWTQSPSSRERREQEMVRDLADQIAAQEDADIMDILLNEEP